MTKGRDRTAAAGRRGRRGPALAGLLILMAGLLSRPAAAEELVIAGSTDRAAMEPLLAAFAGERPDIAVTYRELETVAIDAAIRAGTLDPKPDLVVSSAADLQVGLVNDGYTRAHASEATARLPAWARWRDEAFGFTFEPLVFVINPSVVAPAERPKTREALARFVASRGTVKVATYDVGQSGIGYLAASFDATTMTDYWPFVERMSRAGLETACCTSIVLDLVESGRAAIGYNVLGSYARARKAAGGAIDIVLPEDFTVVITRVAVIPKTAPHPRAAEAFLDFLLSPSAQRLLGAEALLPAGSDDAAAAEARGPVRPISLNASLLAMTDQLRRSRFIALWREVTAGR